MRRRRAIEVFSISFLDLLSGALGAVIILYIAIPKNKIAELPKDTVANESLQRDLEASQKKIATLEKELTAEKNKNAKEPLKVASEEVVESDTNYDVGFKFKGKEIVFIIDTSYSMVEEDRMGQVKAGLKMLLTSLPGNYKIDIVQYPLGERAAFRTMWGTSKQFKSINRMDSFDFIYSLKPSGGTPTRDTLLFVLKNYENISDIVLLSDGAPTFHNSNKKDDIFEILRLVREMNRGKVQINTIGVGSNFLRDKENDQYKFLSLLASENKGFFVGF